MFSILGALEDWMVRYECWAVRVYGICWEMCDMSMKLRLNCLTPPRVPPFLINEYIAGAGGLSRKLVYKTLPSLRGGLLQPPIRAKHSAHVALY